MIAAGYKRKCLVAAIVFLALAFLSKLYSGPFWRIADAYFGDVFIVACLYFILSIIFTKIRPLLKFMAIALFATAVELFQATGIPASLELPRPFVFILGTSFDIYDFAFYAVGLMSAVGLDIYYLQGRSS